MTQVTAVLNRNQLVQSSVRKLDDLKLNLNLAHSFRIKTPVQSVPDGQKCPIPYTMSAIYYFVLAGLCEGVKLDVFYPGFPTMYHVAHEVLMCFPFLEKVKLVYWFIIKIQVYFQDTLSHHEQVEYHSHLSNQETLTSQVASMG